MPDSDVALLARFIVRSLVDDPESVRIEETPGSTMTILSVRVAPGQAGQVIGKHGRNIDALRTLLQSYSGKVNRRVILEFKDEAASVQSEATRPAPRSSAFLAPHREPAYGRTAASGSASRLRRQD